MDEKENLIKIVLFSRAILGANHDDNNYSGQMVYINERLACYFSGHGALLGVDG